MIDDPTLYWLIGIHGSLALAAYAAFSRFCHRSEEVEKVKKSFESFENDLKGRFLRESYDRLKTIRDKGTTVVSPILENETKYFEEKADPFLTEEARNLLSDFLLDNVDALVTMRCLQQFRENWNRTHLWRSWLTVIALAAQVPVLFLLVVARVFPSLEFPSSGIAYTFVPFGICFLGFVATTFAVKQSEERIECLRSNKR